MSLQNATPDVKLAVDLIMLLESNELDPATVLAALDIVRRDYEQKALRQNPDAPDAPSRS